MSRAYRIRVSESTTRILRASDHVATRLEILEILPPEATAALLVAELEALGFEETDEGMVRTEDGVTVVVDTCDGSVVVRSEENGEVTVESERSATVYDETPEAERRRLERTLREEAKKALESSGEKASDELQQRVTDRLEQHLGDVQRELGGVVNRVTAEALKQKAAQLGEIKELTEDPESGNVTIVLEV